MSEIIGIYALDEAHPQYHQLSNLLPSYFDHADGLVTFISLPLLPPVTLGRERLSQLERDFAHYFRGQACKANNLGAVKIARLLDKKGLLTGYQFAHLFEHVCLNLLEPLVARGSYHKMHGHTLGRHHKAKGQNPAVVFNVWFSEALETYLEETWEMLWLVVHGQRETPSFTEFAAYLASLPAPRSNQITREEIISTYLAENSSTISDAA